MNKFKTTCFYILSFTWGILYTLIGSIVMLSLLVVGKKPQRFNDRFYIRVGKHWGGCNLGPWFICDESPSLHTKQHESGHGFQNALWGPLYPFVVCIPSGLRYWLFTLKTQKQREVFCTLVILGILLIGSGFLIPGIIFGVLWAIVIGGLILGYTFYLLISICLIELPKFESADTRPKYDDAWFEGQASEWGAKMYPTETKN